MKSVKNTGRIIGALFLILMLAYSLGALRILEFAMQILSDLSPLLITSLSQEYISAANQDHPGFQVLGSVLLAQRFWANQMVFLTYGLGALIFYYSMYRLKSIPAFLAVWGLIGAPLVLIDLVLDIYEVIPGVRFGFIMGLNEIVLGIWLVVNGFTSTRINSFS